MFALCGAVFVLLTVVSSSVATAACAPNTFCFDAIVASPETPMHTVEPYYVSFALDNAFVRQPGVLPPDQTNSTRIDFADALLRTVVPLVSGGLLRVGGTYTVGRAHPPPTTAFSLPHR
jgi:hypothetical protein